MTQTEFAEKLQDLLVQVRELSDQAEELDLPCVADMLMTQTFGVLDVISVHRMVTQEQPGHG